MPLPCFLPSGRTCLLLLAGLVALLLFIPTDAAAQYATHQKISDTKGGFTGTLDDIDFFGSSVATLGDLDGDGITDLAAGAIYDDDGGTNRGAVWILFLNSDGTVKAHQKISDTEGSFTGTLDDSDFFGYAVAALGDLDGDGVADLAVGAPSDDDGGDRRGAVWILFLNTDGTVKAHQKISNTEGGLFGALDDQDRFGTSIASAGDLNGDGVTDLAVGATGDDDGGTSEFADRGAVWILFLDVDGTVGRQQKISDTEGGFTGMLENLDGFGVSVASLGDLDRDGVSDLAVGAPNDDDGGTRRGALWILFLNTNGTVKAHQKISDTEGDFTGTLDDQDVFGWSLAAAGDLNGDAIPDLAVGAPNDDDGGTGTGAVWILFLNTDGTVNRHQKVSRGEGGFTGILSDYDSFGYAVTSLGDLDGDGIPDLAVGTPGDDDGIVDRGAVYMLFRNNPALTLVPDAPAPVAIGTTFSLNLVAGTADYPVHLLLGAGTKIHYDPKLLSVRSIKEGAFLDDNDLLFLVDVDNPNGVASLSLSRKTGKQGVSGTGVIAEISFLVLDTGNATLTLSEQLAIREDRTSYVPDADPLTLPLYSVLVWPGDTDNDADVDVADLLPIGEHFGETGPARPDASFDWVAQGVLGQWNPNSAVFADALGDGLVSQNDLLPVALNFGNSRSALQQQGSMVAPKTATTPIAAQSVMTIPYRLRVYHNRRKQQARARLVLGSGANPASDLLGTAVTLTYDPAVYSFRSHQPGRLIDDGDLLSLDDKGDGSVSIAYTRKAPNGAVSGRGPVLDVLFDVIGEPHDEAMMLQSLTLGTTEGSIAVVGPDAVAARAELGLDTLPAEPVAAKAEEETPVTFALKGAYPNPFNPTTTIAFDLPDRAEVSLIVVDLLGREVRRLDLGSIASGANQTVRLAADGLPSGVYLYRLEARTSEALHTATGQVTLLK